VLLLNEDDASDCIDAFENSLQRSARQRLKVIAYITKLRDAYYDLAGFDIPDEE
jgi:hypothetical protein